MAEELVGYICVLQVVAKVPAGGKGVEENGRWVTEVSDTVIIIVFLLIILVWIKLALQTL